jgi:hypothetical protein
MEKKSPEKTKTKAMRIRLNWNAPDTERIPLMGDLNGCLLVIPEAFRRISTSGFNKGGLESFPFERDG